MVEGLGLLVAGISALFGYLAWRSARTSVRVSEEQLRLAEEQSEQRPALEVVSLLWAFPKSSIIEKVRLVEKVRQRKNLEPEEGKPLSPSDLLSRVVTQKYPAPEEIPTPEDVVAEREAEDYTGPLPDTVLEVILVNRGRIAASEITGWLYFDPACVKPLEFFGDFEASTILVYAGHRIEHRVKVGGDKDSTLFPSPLSGGLDHPRDYLHFHVPVSIRSKSLPVTTTIKYEFATPIGHSIRGEHQLQLTPEHKHQHSAFEP